MNRRGFLTGLVSLIAAPAIVRATSLMPIKVLEAEYGLGPMLTAIEVQRRINDLTLWRVDWHAHWKELSTIIYPVKARDEWRRL